MSGNEGEDGTVDRRVARTRQALLEAFNALVLSRPYEDIRVGDIVARADVGRSTFYEHYSGRDAIHLDALARPFAILADAVAGTAGEAKGEDRLAWLMAHFWENRARARSTFSDPRRAAVARLLAGLIGTRLESRPGSKDLPVDLVAVQLAEGHLGLLRAWVHGEISARPAEIADLIRRSSKAALDVLAED